MKTTTALQKFTFLLASVATICVSQAAHAEFSKNRAGAVGNCWVEADMKIASGHFIFGSNEGWGRGRIICDYSDGQRKFMKVVLHSHSAGGLASPLSIGLGCSIMEAKMLRHGLIGIAADGPRSLLGKYVMNTKTSASIGTIGAETSIGLSLDAENGRASIPAELIGKLGETPTAIEASIDILFSKLEILPDRNQFLPEPKTFLDQCTDDEHLRPLPPPEGGYQPAADDRGYQQAPPQPVRAARIAR